LIFLKYRLIYICNINAQIQAFLGFLSLKKDPENPIFVVLDQSPAFKNEHKL